MPRKKKAPKPRNYKPTDEQRENAYKIYQEKKRGRLAFWTMRSRSLGENTEVLNFWLTKFMELGIPLDFEQDYFDQMCPRILHMTVPEHVNAATYARNLLFAYSDFSTLISLALSEILRNSSYRPFSPEIAEFTKDLSKVLEICKYLKEECERLQCAHNLLSLGDRSGLTDLRKLVDCLRGIAAMQLIKDRTCTHATRTMDKSLDALYFFDSGLFLIIQKICIIVEDSHEEIASYESVDLINTYSNSDVDSMFGVVKNGISIFSKISISDSEPETQYSVPTSKSGQKRLYMKNLELENIFYALDSENEQSNPIEQSSSRAHRVFYSTLIEQPKFLMPFSKQTSKKSLPHIQEFLSPKKPLPHIQEFLLPKPVEPPECSKKLGERTVKIFTKY